jgi:uncharacterized protein YceK
MIDQKMNRNLIKLMIFAGMLAILSGCATLLSPKDEKEVLTSRLSQMMNAKMAGEWAKAYDYYTPEFRQVVSKTNFGDKSLERVRYGGYTIGNISIADSGNQAQIELTCDISMKGFDFANAPQIQQWKKVGGNWYYQPPGSGKFGFE